MVVSKYLYSKIYENSNLIGPPIKLQVKEMNDITETPQDFLVEKIQII